MKLKINGMYNRAELKKYLVLLFESKEFEQAMVMKENFDLEEYLVFTKQNDGRYCFVNRNTFDLEKKFIWKTE